MSSGTRGSALRTICPPRWRTCGTRWWAFGKMFLLTNMAITYRCFEGQFECNSGLSMLTNFFKLNGECDRFCKHDQLTSAFRNSNELRNVIFLPNTLTLDDLGVPRTYFTGKTFNNVSFSKTVISGITFRRCTFEDCLFMATQFIDCEFHECKFLGCNPQKIVFKETYINPSIFQGMLKKKEHSNIGVHLFQQLYKNAMDTAQPKYARTAEFNMRKWERYDLDYKYPGLGKLNWSCFPEWMANVLAYILVGYGIRARFWLSWMIFVGLVSVFANYIWWDPLEVSGPTGQRVDRTFVDVLFYTASTLGSFGNWGPGSTVGKLVLMIEAGLGLSILTLFLRWLVKLALR